MDGGTLQEPGNVHSLWAVETAVVVLHLRTTTQIDELMRHASAEIQQRWEYLGPSVDKSSGRQPPSTLFKQIDDALQWQSDDIGEYIRHEHFALELTEEQKDTLCPENVVFEYTDYQTLHAYVPFGSRDVGGMMVVVDLVWEGDTKRWVYFNAKMLETAAMTELANSVVEALKSFEARQAAGSDDDDDDDYWSQFVQPEQPAEKKVTSEKAAASNVDDGNSEDDYWGQYGDNGSADSEDERAIESEPRRLVVPEAEIEDKSCDERQITALMKSVELSLRAAAVASQASGVSEAEFLQMAYRQFHAAQQQQ